MCGNDDFYYLIKWLYRFRKLDNNFCIFYNTTALYQIIITWEFLYFHILSQRNDFMINILISYLIVHHCLTLHNGLRIHAILITGHNYDKLEINILSYQNQRYLTKVCNQVHTCALLCLYMCEKFACECHRIFVMIKRIQNQRMLLFL